jgi:uncharacterized phage-like protein YoqJ
MELRAALDALGAITGPVEVRSDSTYLVNGFNKRWYEGWERKDWKNARGQPVANQDLWRPLVDLFHERGDELAFSWVKGHSGDEWNDIVDRLATEAAATQRGRRGTGAPTDLGPADDVGRPNAPAGAANAPAGASQGTGASSSASAASAEAAAAATGAGGTGPGPGEGHRVAVLGHRPPELGGYGDNPVSVEVRRRLTEALAGLAVVHPGLVVLSGLGLGAEQLGAEAAAAAGVPYVAVLAFPEPDALWPRPSREAFRQLLAGAAGTKVLSDAVPRSRQEAGKAIGRRDDWLVGQADGALVVWDEEDKALGRVVRALERRVPDEVWIIRPDHG